MVFVAAFLILPMIAILLIPFFSVRMKGVVLFTVLLLNAMLSGYFAIQTLIGQTFRVVHADY